MLEQVLLPALGESVTEGTVTRWLKAEGDTVDVDEPLVEVSTDKVDTELPSPFAGVLHRILVGEDQLAEIGAALATISSGDASATLPGEPSAGDSATSADRGSLGGGHESEGPTASLRAEGALGDFPANRPQAAPASLTPPTETPDPPVVGAYFTPLVRKLARELKIDVTAVAGTGIGGRVRAGDVRAAAAVHVAPASAAPAAPAPPHGATAAPGGMAPGVTAAVVPPSLRGTVVKAPRIRAVIARRMRESLDTSTQLTQVHEVDVTELVRLRTRAKDAFAAAHGVKLTYLPFIAQAVAEALRVHPMLNASFDEGAGTITHHDAEHLAFAVDSPKGLLVPVVRNAGTLNTAGLAAGIADVAARVRNGTIAADELAGGTFSITNIGSVGALFDTPIINQPQVGILGAGAIVKRVVPVPGPDGGDVLAIRHMMYLCLTYDHRLVDGADAGRFLQTVAGRLSGGAFESGLGL